MKNFTIPLLCVLTIFSACKKKTENPVDSRDQYVGSWTGKITIIIPSIAFNETSNFDSKLVKAENTSDKINFLEPSDNSIAAVATVNGNSFTYDPIIFTKKIDGKAFKMTLTGGGTINGKSLTGVGTVAASNDGNNYSGTWSSSWTK